MKKAFAIIFAALVLTVGVKADVLAWYVGDSAADTYQFSYAVLMSGVTVSGDLPTGTALSGQVSYDATANTTYTDFGSSADKYAIFLYNSDGSLMAYSSVVSKDALANYTYASAPSGVLSPEVGSVRDGGAFTAVPEPTMAFLFGIGLSALALRRRVRV